MDASIEVRFAIAEPIDILPVTTAFLYLKNRHYQIYRVFFNPEMSLKKESDVVRFLNSLCCFYSRTVIDRTPSVRLTSANSCKWMIVLLYSDPLP